jgi:hypothetical protein
MRCKNYVIRKQSDLIMLRGVLKEKGRRRGGDDDDGLLANDG